MMECPFGCNHHTFPNHFNFCPYCGSKLESAPDNLHPNGSKSGTRGKQKHKKDGGNPFPELMALLKGE